MIFLASQIGSRVHMVNLKMNGGISGFSEGDLDKGCTIDGMARAVDSCYVIEA